MLTSITVTGSRSGCKGTEEKSKAKYYNEKKSRYLTASDFTLHLKSLKKKKRHCRKVGEYKNKKITLESVRRASKTSGCR